MKRKIIKCCTFQGCGFFSFFFRYFCFSLSLFYFISDKIVSCWIFFPVKKRKWFFFSKKRTRLFYGPQISKKLAAILFFSLLARCCCFYLTFRRLFGLKVPSIKVSRHAPWKLGFFSAARWYIGGLLDLVTTCVWLKMIGREKSRYFSSYKKR